MKGCRIIGYLPFLAAVLLASGCGYPISEQYRKQARPRVSVAMVAETPADYRGALVIWGGVITRIEHQGGGGSALLVEQYPLDRRGEPRDWEDPGGRFLVKTERYLDPTIYEKGRWVTVAGEVAGVVWERKEKVQYRYPELALRQIHLWPHYPQYAAPPYYAYYTPPYGYGWGYPLGGYSHGPYFNPHFEGGWGWGWW